VSAWIACRSGTALERAIDRAQEGISPAEAVRRLPDHLLPAQEIHFVRGKPQSAATAVIDDPRRGPAGSVG
jgi:hypothetical protein